MNKYIIKTDAERLDNIVYNHYGSLDMMSKVLEANNEIKVIFNIGDIIYLPIVRADIKDNSLW